MTHANATYQQSKKELLAWYKRNAEKENLLNEREQNLDVEIDRRVAAKEAAIRAEMQQQADCNAKERAEIDASLDALLAEKQAFQAEQQTFAETVRQGIAQGIARSVQLADCMSISHQWQQRTSSIFETASQKLKEEDRNEIYDVPAKQSHHRSTQPQQANRD